MNPDQLAAEVSGRYYVSLSEVKAAFSSRGYNFAMSEPEPAVLLPAIKSNNAEIPKVEVGYYFILKHGKGRKIYRFVAYKTSDGYYLQEDIGVKNPYQT